MIIRIIIYIIIGFVLLFGYIKFLERYGVFYPNKKIEITPDSLNITFEDVYIKTKDNLKINGWFIPVQGAQYTILFFHGNAGNLQDRIEKIIMFKELGVSVFIIDYRGYGRSQGKPSEQGLYLDAQAAYDYLVNQRNIKPSQIILFGESLGTAVAIDLATKVKLAGLILEGAFSRGKDMAKVIYPYLPRFFFSNIYDSLTKIKKINCPKLFIHSKDDEIVPFSLAEKLFSTAPEPKKLIVMRGTHNEAFFVSQSDFVSSIAEFIKERL